MHGLSARRLLPALFVISLLPACGGGLGRATGRPRRVRRASRVLRTWGRAREPATRRSTLTEAMAMTESETQAREQRRDRPPRSGLPGLAVGLTRCRVRRLHRGRLPHRLRAARRSLGRGFRHLRAVPEPAQRRLRRPDGDALFGLLRLPGHEHRGSWASWCPTPTACPSSTATLATPCPSRPTGSSSRSSRPPPTTTRSSSPSSCSTTSPGSPPGASKGGQTVLELEQLYPEDIDAVVALVAPIIPALYDEGFDAFIDELGIDQLRPRGACRAYGHARAA